VPPNRLLIKLQHYGVRSHLHDWITSFLLGLTQCVVLDDQSSAATTVSSGVSRAPSWNRSCSYFSLAIYHLSTVCRWLSSV
jgi:hypothetical protein